MIFKKIDNKKLAFKVFFASIIIFLLSIMVIFLKNQADIETILNKNEKDLISMNQYLVEGIYNYYYEILEDSMAQIIKDEEIVRAFANRDKEGLKMLTLPNFDILLRLGIGQYQFHLPDNTSFYRVHNPGYYGDELSSFRKTVVDANLKQKTISGIEKGVAGLGIRYVAPVFFEDEHIGTVELGISLGDKFLKLLENTSKSKWYLFSINDLELSTQLTDSMINKIKNDQPVYIEKENNLLLYIPLADYSNNVKWYFTRYYNIEEENALINRQRKTNLLFAFLVSLFGSIIMILLLKYILKELSYLVEKAKILGEGDFTQAIEAKGTTEIKELSNALETMRQSIYKSKEELEVSKEKFKILSDSVSDWIIWRNPQGKIIYISPSCEQITGYSAEEFINSPNLYYQIIHASQQKTWLEHSHLADKQGNPAPIEFQIITKDGNTKWINHVCSPTYDKNGSFIGIRASNVDITDYKILMEELEDNNKRLKILSNKILHIRELERKHLARELHDELGQILTAVKLSLQMLNEDIIQIDSSFKDRLSESISLVDFATKQVRQQALDLRPPALNDIGIIETIQNKCRDFNNNTNIKTNVILEGDIKNIDQETGLVLYRCVQESLTNVVRHAKAENILIIFKFYKNRLILTVEDDGQGFNIGEKNITKGHMGLIGMEERIDLIDGQMKIISKIDKGTKIEFTILSNCETILKN